MSIYSRFQNSLALFRSSVSVISRQPKLLAFPAVVSLFLMLIVAFFLGGFALKSTGYAWTTVEHWKAVAQPLVRFDTGPGHSNMAVSGTGSAIAILIYLASMFFATFFNVAFYHEIIAALKGQEVSIGRGLSFAGGRVGAILLWSLFAGVIGLIIKAIEERAGLIGRLIARFIGLAWSVASVFAVPVLVCDPETSNPVRILQKSALSLKRTWGETLIGYVGLSFGSGLIALGTVVVIGSAVAVGVVSQVVVVPAIVIGTWLIAVFAFAYVSNVASQVYKAALYLYATESVVADSFSQEMFDQAWKFKKS